MSKNANGKANNKINRCAPFDCMQCRCVVLRAMSMSGVVVDGLSKRKSMFDCFFSISKNANGTANNELNRCALFDCMQCR